MQVKNRPAFGFPACIGKGLDRVKRSGITTLSIAATYIGVVVGAGFATGQEILQFFAKFGSMGILGLALATILFIIYGYMIMDLGSRLKARSHLEITRYSGGRIAGPLMDGLITFFLFGSLSAMMAGTGAIVRQQLNFPGLLGNLLMCALTAATVLRGITGIVSSISFVVPFLLLSVTGISVFSILHTPPVLTGPAFHTEETGLVAHWLTASVLYVSYNTTISIAVLGPLGAAARNKKIIKNGVILGGMGLGAACLLIFLALAGSYSEISVLEAPMLCLAGHISPPVKTIYSIILIAEIYTTAVGSLYGFVSRITARANPPLGRKPVIAVSAAAALLASLLGFSNLVKYLYPLVGYGGILLLACLAYSHCTGRGGRYTR